MAQRLPFHRNFSTCILLLNKKGNSTRFSDNGITVSAVKYNGEIWVLNRRDNSGAVFSADRVLLRGIGTVGPAVNFIKPENMTNEEQTRFAGMFPKKL